MTSASRLHIDHSSAEPQKQMHDFISMTHSVLIKLQTCKQNNSFQQVGLRRS